MFISYEYKSNHKYFEYICYYELIDSKFGTVPGMVDVPKSTYGITIEMSVGVIQEYSKRNLNVAVNLVAFFVWMSKQYSFISIQQLIDQNKQYNPLFPQYEKDLQKYLVLL
jgi:hypothetical protein